MTTPRDDIAGLRKWNDEWPHWQFTEHQHDALRLILDRLEEAATKLDSLLKERDALGERVKEWEEHAGPYWQARALRAEQERDEAIAALKPMAEVAVDIPEHWGDDHQCVTACGHFRRAEQAIRSLAAGPEKEG